MRRLAASLLAFLIIAGATPTRGGHAPEIRADAWLNTAPLRPKDLEGKVILVDFWTFG